MTLVRSTKPFTRFTGKDRQTFKVTSVYCPNEENDTWVTYHNEETLQEYTCRQEAFLARFSPIVE